MDEERIARLFGLTFVTRVLLQALVVIPMAEKECLGFKSHTPAISLALQNLYASLERVECGLAEPAGLRVLDCVGTAVE